LPGKATIRPSDEKRVSTKPPPLLARVSEIDCLCFTFSCSRMMITLIGDICSTKFAKEAWRSPRGGPKSPPQEHRATEEYIGGIFVDPRHRWGAGESTTETQSGFFLIVEYALDGERADAATEPQILERNESRDIHMPCGALNTKAPKTKIPAHWRKRRVIRTGNLTS
jgi:hypothetical protein